MCGVSRMITVAFWTFAATICILIHFGMAMTTTSRFRSLTDTTGLTNQFGHTNISYSNYTDNPIQIAAFCCGGHFKVFPMFLFSLANTYNITKASVARNDSLPLNVTVFMDGFCYHELKKCLTKLQEEYFPFYVIHKQHHENHMIEKNMNSRFFCATYKMHIPYISTFINTKYIMVLDLDIAVNKRLDDLWENVTILHSNPNKAIYATLETSNQSVDGLQHYNVTNLWYKKCNKTHYFPPSGLNTGVMIFNLPLLRQLNFTAINLITMNTQDTTLADQDYINTWAYYYQDNIEIINCKYNIRQGSNCMDKDVNGKYVDLFQHFELSTIFHASNGYVVRGYGKNVLLFNYRRQFGDACNYWV